MKLAPLTGDFLQRSQATFSQGNFDGEVTNESLQELLAPLVERGYHGLPKAEVDRTQDRNISGS